MKFIFSICKKITQRFYSDFLLPNRIEEWESLLKIALERGYEIHSISSFWDILCANKLHDGKYLIVRHDIDTDISTARKLWEAEKKLGITNTSYYFRQSTINIPFMKEVHDAGGEASYHYEELATYVKQKGICDKDVALSHLELIRDKFKENLLQLRRQSNLPIDTVASHGDWANRKLQVTNCVVLDDQAFREKLGVKLETYDAKFMNFVSSRYSDLPYPKFWQPEAPIDAMNRHEKVIYILVHPRQWCANIPVNLAENFLRVWEGFVFFIKAKPCKE